MRRFRSRERIPDHHPTPGGGGRITRGAAAGGAIGDAVGIAVGTAGGIITAGENIERSARSLLLLRR